MKKWQDKLKEIIYILEQSEVNEIEVKFWGRSFRVSKSPGIVSSVTSSAPVVAPEVPSTSVSQEVSKSESVEPEGESVLSPMPGTFYIAPSPDDPPFVKVGDSVKKGQTLCIIEAMKIMNEIESELDGVITKILVDDSGAVEFNQPLFIINPA
ncbi:MAG: acetyl-CoA carboxylase biotin carboxyl carrier protein [Candidatus Marinimicrobia bacterium]|nr:acetyl-CoA carboxylase biotin carboxyl carrier protein [Candidatus Neomarinimicrobiota bacterium]